MHVPGDELEGANSYGYHLWFKYLYRIPQHTDVSMLVNHPHAIAGVTENESYVDANEAGDRALSSII